MCDLHRCEICIDNYEETGENIPLVMNCGHTYCLKCVRLFCSRNSQTCPSCRKNLSDFRLFPKNFVVIAQLTSVNSSVNSIRNVEPNSVTILDSSQLENDHLLAELIQAEEEEFRENQNVSFNGNDSESIDSIQYQENFRNDIEQQHEYQVYEISHRVYEVPPHPMYFICQEMPVGMPFPFIQGQGGPTMIFPPQFIPSMFPNPYMRRS